MSEKVPKLVRWKVQDADGAWYWYESHGTVTPVESEPAPNPNWRDTLQKRPGPEPQCPVCGKPAGEHRDGLWCCPRCGGVMRLFPFAHEEWAEGWSSQCDACWSWGPVRRDKADAIEAGNRRA